MSKPEENKTPISNEIQLGFLITDWHRNNVNHLEAVLKTPADMAIKVNINGEESSLTDTRERALFLIGVEYALNSILQLPFTLEEEPVDDAEVDTNSGDGSEL